MCMDMPMRTLCVRAQRVAKEKAAAAAGASAYVAHVARVEGDTLTKQTELVDPTPETAKVRPLTCARP